MRIPWSLAALAILSASCTQQAPDVLTDPPTGPPSRQPSPEDSVVRVTVSPDTLTLPLASTVVTYTATLLDAQGHTMSGIGVHWSSSDSGVAEPAQGDTTATLPIVTGADTGTAVITATVGSQHGTATLHVVPGIAPTSIAGTWVSDSIQYPDFGPCAPAGYTVVKLVVQQSGDSVVAEEFTGYCTGAAPTFVDQGAATGTVTPPCYPGICLVKLPKAGDPGTLWLSLVSADTLTNITPDSANHSRMPTRFVRQASPSNSVRKTTPHF